MRMRLARSGSFCYSTHARRVVSRSLPLPLTSRSRRGPCSRYLNIAIRAARRAGDLIVRYVDRVDTLTVKAKERNDFVSEVDRQVEDEIVQIIRAAYPDHGILGEESGDRPGRDADWTWVIDPLDGTTNFLHGFPVFSVSIAIKHRGKLEHGVISTPCATSSSPLPARRCPAQQQAPAGHALKSLEGALIGTGFPFREQQNLEPVHEDVRRGGQQDRGIRRAGSAALDLAYVAAVAWTASGRSASRNGHRRRPAHDPGSGR